MKIEKIDEQRDNKLSEEEKNILKLAMGASDENIIEKLIYDAIENQNFRLGAELLFIIPENNKN